MTMIIFRVYVNDGDEHNDDDDDGDGGNVDDDDDDEGDKRCNLYLTTFSP